jgi:hypothetical protein
MNKYKKGHCQMCGVKITPDNWGSIDFVKGILLCRNCLQELELAEKLHDSFQFFKKNDYQRETISGL